MPNYYDVLGCNRDASLEEMKKCYREGARKLHPDKTNTETEEDFSLLSKAWKTLRDPAQREEYDRELARTELTDSPMYCAVDLDEMCLRSDGLTYSYDCRCGGVYLLLRSDITDAEEIRVGCDDCTFHIRINVTRSRQS